MITLEDKLEDAIEKHDITRMETLLKKGADANAILSGTEIPTLLTDAILEYVYEDINWNIVQLLLDYGADINAYVEKGAVTPLHSIIIAEHILEKKFIKTIEVLLSLGANPNIINEEGLVPLSEVIQNDDAIDIINLLFHYGAYVNMNKKYGFMCNCNMLTSLIIHHPNINRMLLLLSFGADPAIPDEYGDNMSTLLERYKDNYKEEDYQSLQTLLKQDTPPYLKLGESDDDKYIIYENKLFNTLSRGIIPYVDATPYLFTNKQKHKDKKYLYADNKIDAFVYWCYINNLLSESVIPVVKLYEEKLDKINYKNINTFITNIIGNEVTTEYFNEEGKEFATSYLTVTHWWYNLHTDFNRLYQEENVKLPRAIKSQEEFDTLMKLLDIRHEQFKSKKDFNSNQNKAELQALIEGKEAPKRVVDLSFLEEGDNIEDDILPDDFLDKN